MNRIVLVCAAGAAALSLAACNQKQQAAAEAPVNAAQDATAAAVGATSASTLGAHDTPSFVSNAGQSDMYEIQAGKIAQSKATRDDVKAFGKMMVADHTALSAEMKPLAAAAGQTPPAALDERRQGMIDNLNAATPADFDNVYLAQQEAAHNEALTLMNGYAANGDDAGLKGAAAKAAPKVQMHLDHVKTLQAGPKPGM